jgi:Uma2 family endonuclease
MSLLTTKKFTISEYHHLTKIGFFKEDDRIELIRGEIVKMAAKGIAHRVCCTKLLRELSKLLLTQATIQCQDPLLLPNGSEPEPDFVILENREDDYLSGHPTPNDIIFLIEIADSSLSYDREVKLPLYAEAKISNYWIINLPEQQLEAYTHPYQKINGNWGYSQQQVFLPHQSITIRQFPDLCLDLSLVFPR